MINERIVPDTRTYAILVRASLTKNLADQAAGLLRGALGLMGGLHFLKQPTAACPNLDYALVNEALLGLAEKGRAQDLAAPLLSEVRSQRPKMRIDPATQRKIMANTLGHTSSYIPPSTTQYEYQERPPPRQNKGKGKGKGKGKA